MKLKEKLIDKKINILIILIAFLGEFLFWHFGGKTLNSNFVSKVYFQFSKENYFISFGVSCLLTIGFMFVFNFLFKNKITSYKIRNFFIYLLSRYHALVLTLCFEISLIHPQRMLNTFFMLTLSYFCVVDGPLLLFLAFSSNKNKQNPTKKNFNNLSDELKKELSATDKGE